MQAMADIDALEALARQIPRVSWFAAAGLPLTGADRAEAMAYARALGFPGVPVAAAVASWPDAKRIANSADATAWWDAEDRIAKDLAPSERARLAALTRVTDAASAAVHGAASVAMARAGIADEYLARAAAGAATQACYHAALALMAHTGDDHPFAIKFRLYEGGRWPLGIAGGRLHLL